MKIYRGYCEASVDQSNKKGMFSCAIYEDNKKVLERHLSTENCTNNRLELMGILMLIKELASIGYSPSDKLMVYTTLKMIPDAIEKHWIRKWCSNGWKTNDGTLVKNKDLWEELDNLLSFSDITILFEKKNQIKLMKRMAKNNRKKLKMEKIFDING